MAETQHPVARLSKEVKDKTTALLEKPLTEFTTRATAADSSSPSPILTKLTTALTEGATKLNQQIDEDAADLMDLTLASHKELQLAELDKKFQKYTEKQEQILNTSIDETIRQFEADPALINAFCLAYPTEITREMESNPAGAATQEAAAAIYLKKQLEIQRDNYLTKTLNDLHNNLKADVEEKFNRAQNLNLLLQADMAERNATELKAVSDSDAVRDELRRNRNQSLRFSSSNDVVNAWKYLIFGPYATLITRDVDERGLATYSFNPRDEVACEKIYLEVLADLPNGGSVTLTLGNQQSGASPDTEPALRRSALRFNLRFRTGGLEFPFSESSFLSTNKHSIDGDYKTPKDVEDYMMKHKSLPPGFVFNDYRVISEVKIPGYTMSQDEKDFVLNAIEISKAIKETQLEMLQDHISGKTPLTAEQIKNIGLQPADFETVAVDKASARTDEQLNEFKNRFMEQSAGKKLDFLVTRLLNDTGPEYSIIQYDKERNGKTVTLIPNERDVNGNLTANGKLYAMLSTDWDNLSPNKVAALGVEIMGTKSSLRGEEKVFEERPAPSI